MMIDRTEEIVNLVTDIQSKYNEVFKKYVKEITDEMNIWFGIHGIPMDLRHALMCYAHQIANDLDLDFAFQLAMQDYDTLEPTKIGEDE